MKVLCVIKDWSRHSKVPASPLYICLNLIELTFRGFYELSIMFGTNGNGLFSDNNNDFYMTDIAF